MAINPFAELLSGEPIYSEAGTDQLVFTSNSLASRPQTFNLLVGAAETVAEVTATLKQVHNLSCGAGGGGFDSGFSPGFDHGSGSCVSAAAEVDGSTLTVTGVTTDFVGWGIPVGVS